MISQLPDGAVEGILRAAGGGRAIAAVRSLCKKFRTEISASCELAVAVGELGPYEYDANHLLRRLGAFARKEIVDAYLSPSQSGATADRPRLPPTEGNNTQVMLGAAWAGRSELVFKLLDNRPPASHPSSKGDGIAKSLLRMAVSSRNVALVRSLIDVYGISRRHVTDRKLMFVAIKGGDVEMLRLLLEYMEKVDDDDIDYLLTMAAKEGTVDVVRFLRQDRGMAKDRNWIWYVDSMLKTDRPAEMAQLLGLPSVFVDFVGVESLASRDGKGGCEPAVEDVMRVAAARGRIDVLGSIIDEYVRRGSLLSSEAIAESAIAAMRQGRVDVVRFLTGKLSWSRPGDDTASAECGGADFVVCRMFREAMAAGIEMLDAVLDAIPADVVADIFVGIVGYTSWFGDWLVGVPDAAVERVLGMVPASSIRPRDAEVLMKRAIEGGRPLSVRSLLACEKVAAHLGTFTTCSILGGVAVKMAEAEASRNARFCSSSSPSSSSSTAVVDLYDRES